MARVVRSLAFLMIFSLAMAFSAQSRSTAWVVCGISCAAFSGWAPALEDGAEVSGCAVSEIPGEGLSLTVIPLVTAGSPLAWRASPIFVALAVFHRKTDEIGRA